MHAHAHAHPHTGKGGAEDKIAALRNANVVVVDSPALMGTTMLEVCVCKCVKVWCVCVRACKRVCVCVRACAYACVCVRVCVVYLVVSKCVCKCVYVGWARTCTECVTDCLRARTCVYVGVLHHCFHVRDLQTLVFLAHTSTGDAENRRRVSFCRGLTDHP